MSSFVSRLVACLVAVVAVLQLVHLVLLNQLESRRLSLTETQQSFHPQPSDPKPLAIYNGNKRKFRESRVDFNENELLMDRLFRDDQATIVDSTGEYRVIFDIAGPQRDSTLSQSQTQNLLDKASITPSNSNNDDFSIDEDIALDQIPSLSDDITLVTHSDLHSAHKYLLPLVERWNGPVSLVLFAKNSSTIESTLGFIAQARLCSDVIRQYVNFHVVFPLIETHLRSSSSRRRINKTRLEKKRSTGSNHSKSRSNSIHNKSLETECQHFQTQSSKFHDNSRESDTYELNSDRGVPAVYPSNLLRNMGRKRVLTDYSLVIPIDMVPSEGLRGKFQKMVRKRKGVDEKTVFVIPALETKNGETPESKRELLKLVHNYQARPYHFELCWKCQVHTDYESWGREAGKEDELSVMYEVLWKDPWVPFFISENSVPLFDEGFRHLTFDRLSQLCELHVAGYKFAVLNEPFLIHPGHITQPLFYPSKNANLDTSRARFRQFKHELKNKYPHSTRRCY